jgi:hypothetical protein
MRIWLHTLGLMLAASLIASCGMRTAITPEADDVKAAEGIGMDAGMPCGFGPPCDPSDFGGRTCEMFGLGGGTLTCDPKTCNFVLKGCDSAPSITPAQTGTDMMGTGGQGTVPGLFGDLGGTGGAGAFPFFGGGTGGAGAFPFFGGVPDGGFPPFFGGQTNNSDEDGGVPPNPGFFGGAFFGGQ